MTYFKATRPDGLGKFVEDRLDFGIVGRDAATFAHVAGGTRQNHVLKSAFTASRGRSQVIQVKHDALVIEELQDSTLRNFGSRGFGSAVLTNSAVTLGDSIANRTGYVSGIRHATSLASGVRA